MKAKHNIVDIIIAIFGSISLALSPQANTSI